MHRSSPCPLTTRPAGGVYTLSRVATGGLLAVAAACLAITPARAVTIDWVTVGNPGNTNDSTGYGAVGYEYRIGKYEVTIQQYTEFLNAVDPDGTNPYELYNSAIQIDDNIKGILLNGEAARGQKYSVLGGGDRPVSYVSWFDAARFANWMQNGQGSGSTETGAYTLNGSISGTAPARNAGAQFYIPTENEWYKAAYFSPLLNSGSGAYYAYATQSNSAPGNTIGGGSNQANFYVGSYPNGSYATGGGAYSSTQNYLTDRGTFTNSDSYYGTFDQNGNLSEWNDLTGAADTSRGLRGGSWYNSAFGGVSSYRDVRPTWRESQYFGFRLASPIATVPEPSTWVMAAGGLAWAACGAWRHRRRR